MFPSERHTILREFDKGYDVHWGQGPWTPFVFSSPHSGAHYPDAFLAASRLTPSTIRKSEDSFVDDLFANVTALGAPLVAARFPRAYLDLNRQPYELDPLLFADSVPEFATTDSVRVLSGLGTLPRVVADNEPIYEQRLPISIAFERINLLYKPFHAALAALLAERHQLFGHAILIDCHSMPSSPGAMNGGDRPDIILGDRFGMSCGSELTLTLLNALKNEGFEVVLNRPYAGGYITEHYGQPTVGVQAIQIELNRALYMNEADFVRTRAFSSVQRSLDRALTAVFAAFPGVYPCAEAAE